MHGYKWPINCTRTRMYTIPLDGQWMDKICVAHCVLPLVWPVVALFGAYAMMVSETVTQRVETSFDANGQRVARAEVEKSLGGGKLVAMQCSSE